MPVVTISRIQHRKGLQEQLPQLAAAELGWAMDSRKLYIGNGTVSEGAPEIGNTEILTEYSEVLDFANQYTYKNSDAGYNPVTGKNDINFNSTIYHNGLYLSVGSMGTIIYTSDRQNFKNINTGINNDLLGVTYGNGYYVAVGTSGVIVSSPTATAWKVINSNSYSNLTDITFGNGLFIACTSNGTVLYSGDSVTWLTVATGVTTKLNSITYGNNLFVACGINGVIISSLDGGKTWTKTTIGNYTFNKVYYNNGIYYVTGSNGRTYSSTDGIKWSVVLVDAIVDSTTDNNDVSWFLTSWGDVYNNSNGIYSKISTIDTNYSFSSIQFANGTFVACTENGAIYTSSNAYVWTQQVKGGTESFYSIYYEPVGQVWYITGGNGILKTSSDNGLTWITQTYVNTGVNFNLYGLTYINNVWVAVGAHGTVIRSVDGIHWVSVTFPDTNDLTSIITATPNSSNAFLLASGTAGTVYASYDEGLTWSKKVNGTALVGSTVVSVPDLKQIYFKRWTNVNTITSEHYVAVGDGGTIITSTDLVTWTKQTTGFNSYITCILFNNLYWYAAGEGGILFAKSNNLTNWSYVREIYGDTSIVPDIFTISASNSYNIMAGEYGIIYISASSKYFRQITNVKFNVRGITDTTNLLAVGDSGVTARSMQGDVWVSQSFNFSENITRRSIQSKLDDFVSVKDFGAKGDGTSDDTAAINLALRELYVRPTNPAARKTLWFPAGHYIVSDSINVPSYANLKGEGPGSTIIEQTRPLNISPQITWVFYTADSLQQIQSQMGFNNAGLPSDLSFKDMTLISLGDGIWVDRAMRVQIHNVRFQGNKIRPTQLQDSITGQPSCGINFRGVQLAPPTEINITDCHFDGFNTALFADDQQYLINITVHSCSFINLFQGIRFTVFSGLTRQVTVSNCFFDQIFDSGILVDNTNTLTSTFNYYKEVGNNYLGDNYPSVVIVKFGDSSTNCASIADSFDRSDASNKIEHRITENVNSSDWYFGQGIRLGAFQQMNGRSVIIVNNNTAYINTNLDEGFNNSMAIEMLYTIVRGTNIRKGLLRLTTNGTIWSLDDDVTDIGDVGVILNFDGTDIKYTSTNSGQSGLLNYAIRYMEML